MGENVCWRKVINTDTMVEPPLNILMQSLQPTVTLKIMFSQKMQTPSNLILVIFQLKSFILVED